MISIARRVPRIAGWCLFPLLLLQFLSGYAILHGRVLGAVLGKPSAFRLHRIIQPLTMVAFTVHALPWVRRALAGRGIRHRGIDVMLIVVGGGLIGFALYLYSRG